MFYLTLSGTGLGMESTPSPYSVLLFTQKINSRLIPGTSSRLSLTFGCWYPYDFFPENLVYNLSYHFKDTQYKNSFNFLFIKKNLFNPLPEIFVGCRYLFFLNLFCPLAGTLVKYFFRIWSVCYKNMIKKGMWSLFLKKIIKTKTYLRSEVYEYLMAENMRSPKNMAVQNSWFVKEQSLIIVWVGGMIEMHNIYPCGKVPRMWPFEAGQIRNRNTCTGCPLNLIQC